MQCKCKGVVAWDGCPHGWDSSCYPKLSLIAARLQPATNPAFSSHLRPNAIGLWAFDHLARDLLPKGNGQAPGRWGGPEGNDKHRRPSVSNKARMPRAYCPN